MPTEHHIQSKNDAISKAFVCAKWLAYLAIAMTPLMPIVAVWKQMHDELLFSFVACAFVPLMAGVGYWACWLFRLLTIARRDDEGPSHVFPPNWPIPFSLFNLLYRLSRHPQFRRYEAASSLTAINFFVVIWCGFLLFWVVVCLVVMLLHT